MKVILPSASGNAIATIAIGQKYLENFYEFAFPSWKRYCEKHNLGLILFEDNLVPESDPFWKKATWQKLLIGKVVGESHLTFKNICYLDTDIIISPIAKNIFDSHDDNKISVISMINNLPFPDYVVRKRVAFFRNRFLDKRYPLDSALFSSPKQIFEYHGKEPQDDYFTAGVFVFNIEKFSTRMEEWFYSYPKGVDTLTGGGDEPILNYEFQASKQIKFLEYKFQALWYYEMAWKYPFLYEDIKNNELIKSCIETVLLDNYFLHFCGSWAESDMFYKKEIFMSQHKIEMAKSLSEYIDTPFTGKPVGMIKPL
jgi:hypothetical protein